MTLVGRPHPHARGAQASFMAGMMTATSWSSGAPAILALPPLALEPSLSECATHATWTT